LEQCGAMQTGDTIPERGLAVVRRIEPQRGFGNRPLEERTSDGIYPFRLT
jgi:hypothetical protein